ncbi:hypothetical protein GGX14DRAFT_408106 [Mycena pura]|uniref:Uncharacterized protein n=1 Tax=Mycena pura TaxID=153505 RepID=A0AAD6UQW7_9AGAR|nr:hypothetical protein GGX14DRAFT_408106 [Mycena pura]
MSQIDACKNIFIIEFCTNKLSLLRDESTTQKECFGYRTKNLNDVAMHTIDKCNSVEPSLSRKQRLGRILVGTVNFDAAKTKLTITSGIWAALEDKMEGERLGLYYEKSGMLIVTCPTAIHEAVQFLAQPFKFIAVTNPSFVCDTNTDVPVGIDDKGTSAKRAADFAFGSMNGKYAIVFECGYSEPDLESRVGMWFGIETVLRVVTLKFVCGDYTSPPASKVRPRVAVDFDTFATNSQTTSENLGSVTYDGHVRAHDIDKIEIGVYHRNEGKVDGAIFDITPGAADLDTTQQFINNFLRKATRQYLGDAKFREIFPTSSPSSIDWTLFYKGVQSGKMRDAYCRYVARAKTTRPKVTVHSIPDFFCKRERDLDGAGSVDEDERPYKAHKTTDKRRKRVHPSRL